MYAVLRDESKSQRESLDVRIRLDRVNIGALPPCCLSREKRRSTRDSQRPGKSTFRHFVASVKVAAGVPGYTKNEDLSGLESGDRVPLRDRACESMRMRAIRKFAERAERRRNKSKQAIRQGGRDSVTRAIEHRYSGHFPL